MFALPSLPPSLPQLLPSSSLYLPLPPSASLFSPLHPSPPLSLPPYPPLYTWTPTCVSGLINLPVPPPPPPPALLRNTCLPIHLPYCCLPTCPPPAASPSARLICCRLPSHHLSPLRNCYYDRAHL
ncbi:hypothetical protein E2C01_084687 [Portunus trituberculatus]|uniref:Uncharacterized protein n=1 Tax=Portunus trituberculatus TaxID=210409 RepID=A0A5B7J9Y2_PORTR|nr:hypothetical protein [Portunus trituberculatus]